MQYANFAGNIKRNKNRLKWLEKVSQTTLKQKKKIKNVINNKPIGRDSADERSGSSLKGSEDQISFTRRRA